jgi:hypothetical protein
MIDFWRALRVTMWHTVGLLVVLPATTESQVPLPIIDMHLHALAADGQGPPPLALCLPTTTFGAASTGASWGAQMLSAYQNPGCANPQWSPRTDE